MPPTDVNQSDWVGGWGGGGQVGCNPRIEAYVKMQHSVGVGLGGGGGGDPVGGGGGGGGGGIRVHVSQELKLLLKIFLTKTGLEPTIFG